VNERARLAPVPVEAKADTGNVVHISGLRSPVAASRRTEWRELMRKILKAHGKRNP